MGMEGFVNLVNMNNSSSSDRTMSIQQPSCFFNLCSSCSSRSNKRRRDCLLPPPRGRLMELFIGFDLLFNKIESVLPRRPHRPTVLPLLA